MRGVNTLLAKVETTVSTHWPQAQKLPLPNNLAPQFFDYFTQEGSRINT
jgi:hypothetical protein